MGIKSNRSDTDYVILANKGVFRDLNPNMALFSKGLILAFVIFTLYDVDFAASTFSGMQSWIQDSLDWFYVLSMCVFVGFTFYLMCSRYGHIRLGKDNDRPEFSYFSWF